MSSHQMGKNKLEGRAALGKQSSPLPDPLEQDSPPCQVQAKYRDGICPSSPGTETRDVADSEHTSLWEQILTRTR